MNGLNGYLTDEDYVIAEANGISKDNAYQRVYTYGWDVEKAITEPLKRQIDIKSQWEKYKDASKVAKSTFYGRLAKGWESEKAALTPPILNKSEDKYPDSKIKAEHIKIAEANGITRNTLISRVHTYKWDIERATTEPPKHNGRKKK